MPRGARSSATCTTARSSGSSTLALDVQVARKQVRTAPDSAGPFLDRLAKELSETSAELRELARGIHPAVLTERGLLPAIEALGGRAPVPVEIVGEPIERLSPTLEVTAYFTVSEALTNVAKYARASLASVRLAVEDGALVIEVGDDGVGGARAGVGSGLSGLADRVGACDGTLSVDEPAWRGDARAGRAAARRLTPAQSGSSSGRRAGM